MVMSPRESVGLEPRDQAWTTDLDELPPAKNTLLAGAQPVMPANSFQSRFSAFK